MPYLNSIELLYAVENAADALYLCSQEPTTYTQASSTYKLAQKLPPTIIPAGAGTPNGGSVGVSAITDGTVTASGTATHWALCASDFNGAPALIATGALAANQALTSGNTFTLSAIGIRIPAATAA